MRNATLAHLLTAGQRYLNRLADRHGWTPADCTAFLRSPLWHALDAAIAAAALAEDVDWLKASYHTAWAVVEGPSVASQGERR